MIGVYSAMPESPEVSVVIPVRNERENIEELERRLREVLPPAHEILFVDDGSDDGTWERLERLHAPGRVRPIKLRGPHGKAAALMVGFGRARAAVIFTLDGDLQDDPAEIPAFLRKLGEGYDLVTGWKRVRHDPWHKVVASRLFNAMMRFATGSPLHDMNCGFKCYRAEVVRSLRIRGDQHRFIPVFAERQGYRVAEIEVRHHPRRHSRSKYGFSRLLTGWIDLGTVLLRTRYRGRPAHGFGLAAGLCGLAALALLGHAAVRPPAAPLTFLAGALGIACASGAFAFLAAGWVAELRLDSAASDSAEVSVEIEDVRD